MSEIMILEIGIYRYYSPTVSIDFRPERAKEDFKGKKEYAEDWCGDGEGTYYLIENRNDFIHALGKVKACEEIDFPKHEIGDLIKLLSDGALGEEFYNNLIENVRWVQQARIIRNLADPTKGFIDFKYDYSLEFYILGNKHIAYWVKNNLDFQRMILEHCIKEKRKFNKECFTIPAEEIEETISRLGAEEKAKVLKDKKKRLKELIVEAEKLRKEIEEEENVGLE